VRLFDEVQARTEELSESLRQQTATAEVLKTISRSTFDLKSVLQTLIESAAKLCEADKAAITRQINGVFFFAETYGFSPEYLEYIRDLPVKPERGFASGRALLEGKTVHIADVLADPNYTWAGAQRVGGFRTVLAVPMLREGMPIGVLGLTRSEVRPFTDKQIELVTTFADQAVIAIENVRLFDELRESLQRQTATSEVLQVISSSPGELEPVFKTMMENATRLCEADSASLGLCEGADVRIVARYNASAALLEQTKREPLLRPGPASSLGRSIKLKQVVQVPISLTIRCTLTASLPVFVSLRPGTGRSSPCH
jgi:transcriptional regulator with GAF, ATPase, and Fis domain